MEQEIITAGALIRGQIRAFLRAAEFNLGITWEEERLFLKSYFLVRGSAAAIEKLRRAMTR